MKVRTKLTVLSIALSGAALLVCGALLLNTTANKNVQHSIDNAITDLTILNTTFVRAVTNAEYQGLSAIAKRSLILYVFGQYNHTAFSATQYALTQEEATLYNQSPLAPYALREQMETVRLGATMQAVSYCTVSSEREIYILASTDINFGDDTYTLSLIRDISKIYESNNSLAVQYTGICLLAFAILALILIFVTKRTLIPLELLKCKVSQMVEGKYEGHIVVKGKDEIASLTRDFNTMVDAIQAHVQEINQTSEERRLLIGALTHELKTPMTAILANAETLERTKLNEEQRNTAISFIGRECRRLEMLTQKMMRFLTLLEGEEITIEETPVVELFDMAAFALAEICDRENIALTFHHENQSFKMDKDLLTSVCTNLFDNARKAGATQIAIEAKGNSVIVTDNGQGIPEKECAKLVQPFYMVDKSRSKRAGGIGLGMTIVNRIAQLHHAELHIDSLLGKGTKITFQFLSEFTF